MATNYLYCAGDISFNSTVTPTVAYCYSNISHLSLSSFCASTSCGLPNYSNSGTSSSGSTTTVNLVVPQGTYVPLKLDSGDANDIVTTFTQVLICVVVLWGFKKLIDIILSAFNLR